MQVNNSVNLTSQPAIGLGKNSSVPAQEQRTKVLAREALSSEESQKSPSDINTRQRLDIDEQAMALIERQPLSVYDSGNSSQQSPQQNYQQTSTHSGYDTPSSQNKLAVAAYQSVDAIAQRDSIQQIFGVDLFA
ncbi:hypothetical protein H4J59_04200 [Colwellia sp. MB02u-10]|uniref:hypothetical protein n=1 Tax=Colwellia sp. MB02u-10 TaxID=2759828 RepID=UPI0015F5F830|nr:hypothetical protein [Colwellia sp. MB02u-10]MBA6340195.1 hypothetical protein [Colwellia sp. MB02u-10]